MADRSVTQVAPAALVIGALLGMAGTFVSSETTGGLLRGLLCLLPANTKA